MAVLDSGTSCFTHLCLSRKLSNCVSVITNDSAFLRASGPTFSPSISKHWNTCKIITPYTFGLYNYEVAYSMYCINLPMLCPPNIG